MENILTAYNSNGTLEPDLWFSTIFKTIPCKYEYMVGIEPNQLDESSICAGPILKFFKNIIGVREYTNKTIDEKDKEVYQYPVELENPNFLDFIRIDNDSSVIIVGDNRVVYLRYDRCYIWYDYNKDNVKTIAKLAEDIFNSFPKAKIQDKTAKVGLVKVSQNDYYVSFSEINSCKVNIEENYNDDFQPVYKDIVDFLDSRGSGLILLWGKVGSGKTNFIRHLCSTHPKDYVIIPNGIAGRLGDPELISFITACKDNVFILEDCEQLLMDRANNPWNNAISSILNMADGLLSDIVNIKLICTFNAGIEKIDPALLRKGRCFAKYEFKDLEPNKVDHLNEKYKLGLKEIKPMTLAEIYNNEKTDYSEQGNRKIGL